VKSCAVHPVRQWLSARRQLCTGSGTGLHELAFAQVAGERCGTLELHAGLGMAPELFQQVAAHGGQQVVVRQRGFVAQCVDQP